MRKLVVMNLQSLDGSYEGPGNNVMALPLDGAFDQCNLERMRAAGTVLLGGNSYRMFSGFWPGVVDDPSMSDTNREFSRLYNTIEKVVVSDTATLPPEGHPWAGNTRIIARADAHEQIAKLKQEDGEEIVMWASRTLWNDLLRHGLVDELYLMVGSVLLGGGPRIVEDQTVPLRRLDLRTFEGSDNVLLHYEVLASAESADISASGR